MSWTELPNTRPADALDPRLYPPYNPHDLMTFSGGDLAAIGGVTGFVLVGGGHAATPDNSCLFIPLDGSGPRRLTGPYIAPDGVYKYDEPYEVYRPEGIYTDAMKSRHTYDSLIVFRMDGAPHLFVTGGSLYTGPGGTTPITRILNLSKSYVENMARSDMGWQRVADAPMAQVASASFWDRPRDRIVVHTGQGLCAYSYRTDTWAVLRGIQTGSDIQLAAVTDGVTAWFVGPRWGFIINLDAGVESVMYSPALNPDGTWRQDVVPGYEWCRALWGLSPGFPPGSDTAYGAVWHRKRLIVSGGGQDIVTVNPVTGATARIALGGATVPVDPTLHGRFRLIPKTDTVVQAPDMLSNCYASSLPTRHGVWETRLFKPDADAYPIGYMANGGGKHGRCVYRPATGELIFAGGDWWPKPRESTNGDFVGTEVWALAVATDTWRRLHPYCTEGEHLPARPDNVCTALDTDHDELLIVPGFYGGGQGGFSCANVTTFSTPGIFSFLTGEWREAIFLAPPDGWGGDSNSSFGCYDPVTKEFIRVRWSGGWGCQIERFNRATWTWRVWYVPEPARMFWACVRSQVAFDARDGVLYLADPGARVMWAFHHRLVPGAIEIATHPEAIEQIPLPPEYDAGPLPAEQWMVFDPARRRIYFPNTLDFGNSPVQRLLIYDVASARWTVEPVPTEVWGSVWGFDEGAGQLVGIGKRTNPSCYVIYTPH